MKTSITISDVETDNETIVKIMISGAENYEEVLETKKEWCDENNCILLNNELANPIKESDDKPKAFYAN